MAYEYNDPIISNPRLGTSDSPYREIQEALIVDKSGKVQLNEYPNKFNKVIVTDSEGNGLFESKSPLPNEQGYFVDYEHKIVTFHIDNIGKQYVFKYFGEGNSAIPASSVYTERDGLTIVETLKDLTDTTREVRDDAQEAARIAVEAANTIDEAVGRADELVDNTNYHESYNPDTTYHKNNIVSFNGSSFMAKQTTIGNFPPDTSVSTENDYWGLLSRKGADGTGTVHVHKDTFVATEGQRVFELEYIYDQFQNRTNVMVGGVPQKTPENYEETTDKIITLSEGVPEGTVVEIKYFSEAVPLQSDIQTTVDNHTNAISNHTVSLNQVTEQLAQIAINVKSFGAVGDGVTDDTEAFTDAIEYALLNNRSIYIPNGQYLITDTVYTGGGNSFTLYGQSINSTQILFQPALETTPFLHFPEEVYKAKFQDLKISGVDKKGVFIKADYDFRQSVLENLSFEYIHTCFDFRREANALIFTNVRSIAVEYQLYIPNEGEYYSFNQVSFYNCNFRATQYGIYVLSACNNVTFYDCIFDIKDSANSDGKGAIYFTFPRNLSVIGGYIEARNCSVFEFEHTALHTYDMQVKMSGVYFVNANTTGRNSTGLKVSGRISLKLDSCYFNGWDKAVDCSNSTGTLISENNSFANNNTTIIEPTSGTTLKELRGVYSYGQNSNGDWIRFVDGTQECSVSLTTSSSSDITWTFPNSFANTTNLAVVGSISRSFGEIVGVSFSGQTSSKIDLRAFRLSGSEVQRIGSPVYVIARGRWK